MLASIIIPTHNRASLLQRALISVVAQTVDDFEIIVVDDASTEDIESAVRAVSHPKVRVVRRPVRGGAAAARNSGVSAATGRYIAFLDSDDEWRPGKLARQLDYLRESGEVALCCTGFELVGADGRRETRLFDKPRFGFTDLAFGCGLSPGSTLCARRSVFDAAGPFNEGMPRLEDWEWLLRATAGSPIGIVNQPLAIINKGAWPSEQAVRTSTRLLREAHAGGFWRSGPVYGLRFAAALLNERAVAAFRAGAYGRAGWFFALSMAVYPIRSRSFFRRVGMEARRVMLARFGRAETSA